MDVHCRVDFIVTKQRYAKITSGHVSMCVFMESRIVIKIVIPKHVVSVFIVLHQSAVTLKESNKMNNIWMEKSSESVLLSNTALIDSAVKKIKDEHPFFFFLQSFTSKTKAKCSSFNPFLNHSSRWGPEFGRLVASWSGRCCG